MHLSGRHDSKKDLQGHRHKCHQRAPHLHMKQTTNTWHTQTGVVNLFFGRSEKLVNFALSKRILGVPRPFGRLRIYPYELNRTIPA